ncbi:MAG: TRAP transporter small permease [Rhodospirillales bacterium]|nr:TRAP transporter small permease [Rhodospirillales bacterium]
MQSVTTAIERIVEAVRIVVRFFVIFAFAYMCVAVFAQVLGRYFFNYSIDWAVETATWSQIWIVLLGSGLAMQKGMHVSIDMLAQLFPLWLARVASVAIALGCVWFLGVVFYGSLPLIQVGSFERSPAMHMPMWVIYLGLPIGASYFALEVVASLIRRWDAPFAAERGVEEEVL